MRTILTRLTLLVLHVEGFAPLSRKRASFTRSTLIDAEPVVESQPRYVSGDYFPTIFGVLARGDDVNSATNRILRGNSLQTQSVVSETRDESSTSDFFFLKAKVDKSEDMNVEAMFNEGEKKIDSNSAQEGKMESTTKQQEKPEFFFPNVVSREPKPIRTTLPLPSARRSRAAEISHSFRTQNFNPPWYARNNHFQTIAGVIKRAAYGNPAIDEFAWDERVRMETPDGDFFDVDHKYAGDGSDESVPLVLICHGLQASSESPLSKDLAMAYNNIGMDAACINFRGCSGEINRTPFGYHLSFTDDLRYMLEHIRTTQPNRVLYLSGFSLGANVVTKCLCDLGEEAASKYNICGAAVNALPFDVQKTYANLNKPCLSKTIYGDRLLKSMLERIKDSGDAVDLPFSMEDVENCKSIIEMENLVICSLFDFDDAFDYYRQSSTWNRLDQVAVPQLVLQAKDDPFFVGNTNPSNDPNRPLRIDYQSHGGHCGFVLHEGDDTDGLLAASSWMPAQLARFLQHVNDNRDTELNYRPEVEMINKFAPPPTLKMDTKARAKAADISHSFRTEEFSPPWYAQNNHLQTILGVVARSATMYASSDRWAKGAIDTFRWDERTRMDTPDGDFFDVDFKYVHGASDPSRPLVLICHGLQSSSDSPLVKDLATAYNHVGMDAACVNFRGCSGEVNLTPRGYHLGFTDDLLQMLGHVQTTQPGREVYLSGFSLGANVVTKTLCDLGEEAESKYNVCGAAVNALPFDPSKTQANINEPGFSKLAYGNRLVESMKQRFEDSFEKIEYPFSIDQARECKTVIDVERIAICKVFGFDDPYDYYRKTCTWNRLDQVAVPQLVIQALDDPFFKGNTNPTNDPDRPLRVQYTKNGGHCGYILHGGDEKAYEQNMSTSIKSLDSSWMPTQLARFLQHVHQRRKRGKIK